MRKLRVVLSVLACILAFAAVSWQKRILDERIMNKPSDPVIHIWFSPCIPIAPAELTVSNQDSGLVQVSPIELPECEIIIEVPSQKMAAPMAAILVSTTTLVSFEYPLSFLKWF